MYSLSTLPSEWVEILIYGYSMQAPLYSAECEIDSLREAF